MCMYCVYSKQIQLGMSFLWRNLEPTMKAMDLIFTRACKRAG